MRFVWRIGRLQNQRRKRYGGRVMKKNKLELTDKEYDALRALLYQTTTSAYAKAVGCAVFMAAHLELFPETYKTLQEINKKINS